MEITLWNGEKRKLLDVFKTEDFVDGEDGEKFVRLASLLRVAKQVYSIISYDCIVEQTPNRDNEWCAVVTATYTFFPTCGDYHIRFSGTADCRADSTAPGFEKYTVALAEARAKARALRDALGVELCSNEEIAKKGKKERSFINSAGEEKIEPTQIMLIEKKFLGETKKTLKDIETIIGHSVENLENLSKEEGALVLEAFNKNKKSKEDSCKK